MYHADSENDLKYFPRLTQDHISLTPYSVMNVRLVAQVLSETLGNILKESGSADDAEIAGLILKVDRLFDCCNFRNTKENKESIQPFLAKYESQNDERFNWLKNEFLKYFEDWKESIANRPGNFTANAISKIFLSWQTYVGLKITTISLTECVKFLLGVGFPYRNIFADHFYGPVQIPWQWNILV